MNTKLVYVVSATEDSSYMEKACVSAYSARYHNPHIHIAVVTDDATDRLLAGPRSFLLTLVDEKIVVPFKSGESAYFRSRWMKTNLRNLIDGNILYLDTDTVVTGPLDAIEESEFAVGAVPDGMKSISDYPSGYRKRKSARCRRIGFDLSGEQLYFNGGVLYYSDSEEAHEFSLRWHRCWLEYYEIEKRDQPSLNKVNAVMAHFIEPLNLSFNCQMNVHPHVTQHSSILHFATSSRKFSWLYSPQIKTMIRTEGIRNKFLIHGVTHPFETYIPFAAELTCDSLEQAVGKVSDYADIFREYSKNIDSEVQYYKSTTIVDKIVRCFLRRHAFYSAAFMAIMTRWLYSRFISNK